MNVAVIDNIDSFVYNLVQYVGELGVDPVVFQNDVDLNEIEAAEPERIIISPGPKRPEDAGISVEVVKKLGVDIPTLGVCLGHQIIAYAFGGEVSYADRIMHGKTSKIQHDKSFLYDNVPNPLEGTRYHSLIVSDSDFPDCFHVTARTRDENAEIMGIEHKDYPIFGVQFHPESVLTPSGKQIIKNFLGR